MHLSVHESGGLHGVVRTESGDKLVLEPTSKYPMDAPSMPSHHDTVVYLSHHISPDMMQGVGAGGAHGFSPCGGHESSSSYERVRMIQEQNLTSDESRLVSRHDDQEQKEVPEKEGGTAGGFDFDKIFGSNGNSNSNGADSGSSNGNSNSRSRRSEGDCRDWDTPACSCDMAMVGDYDFFTGPHAQEDRFEAIQHMVNVIVEADQIFRETDFDGVTGLGFIIRSATLHVSREDSMNPVPAVTYGDGSGADFLEAVTNGLGLQYRDVCTVQLFTYRDFEEGILGMAWVGQPGGYGGICDSGFNKAFNTGVNYGVVVTPFIASLVVAHEVGHNCGAEHDVEGGKCGQGGEDGNYIMFAAATDGTKPNNRVFSECSVKAMSQVMKFLQPVCFLEAGLRCGDGFVDGHEECDCGAKCNLYSCCTKECKINYAAGYECSPQNSIKSECCGLDCKFLPSEHRCQKTDDCAAEAYCTGGSSTCPMITNEDETPCNCLKDNCTMFPGTNAQTCTSGICAAFICEDYGAVQCGLPGSASCQLGCKGDGWGYPGECVSTFGKKSKMPDGFRQGRFLNPGTPCMGYHGICDGDGVCQSSDTMDTKEWTPPFTQAWMVKNWKYCALAIGVVVLVAMVIKHVRFDSNRKRIRAMKERAHMLEAANAQAELEEMDLQCRALLSRDAQTAIIA